MKSYSSVLNTLLVIVIIVASLFLAREVLLPITLAAILSFMLAPLVRALQNLRLPRELAAVSVVLLAFAAIFALGTITARQVTELAGNLPHYQATISAWNSTFRPVSWGDPRLGLSGSACGVSRSRLV
jgi:predicted PurR-regulated permease PerM